MKQRIGIVGGSGYIGYSLSRHLSTRYKIKCLDIIKPRELLNGDLEFMHCDIRNPEEVKRGLKDVDLVIHSAIVQIPLINEEKRLGYEVNILGTQNICEAVFGNAKIKGMILAGSWHTMGEKELSGIIDEEFGFRPDKIENRARLYALSKIVQEVIVRFYDEMSDRIYGVIRLGTVLGEGMPQKTAANIFIERGLKGESITPYKHSMYRLMLYVDISDVCRSFENSLANIVNVFYPEPITIIELAETVRDEIVKITNSRINPKIEILDLGMPQMFTEEDKKQLKVNVDKMKRLLGIEQLKSPEQSIKELIRLKVIKQHNIESE